MSSMPDRDLPEDALRRKPAPGCRVRYDDEDDYDIGQPRGAEENASSAGMIGFIFSAVSIGLIAVVVVLWIFKNKEDQQRPNVDRERWILYWFLFLDLLSFFAALTATILGSRGLSRANPLYRGWAMVALILGIIELVGTVLFGIFMTCFVLIFEAFGGG